MKIRTVAKFEQVSGIPAGSDMSATARSVLAKLGERDETGERVFTGAEIDAILNDAVGYVPPARKAAKQASEPKPRKKAEKAEPQA